MGIGERFGGLLKRKEQPVTPSDTPAPKGEGMSRREFLGKGLAVAATVGLSVRPWLESAQQVAHEEGTNNTSEGEKEKIDFDTLNRDTALPVALGFAGIVGNAAAFGGSIDPISVVAMNALEGNRLAQLAQRGGEEGKHLAAEELHENIVAGGISVLLAGISDLTTSAVEFKAERILAATTKMEKQDLEDNPKRPEISASLEDWERYVEAINNDVADQVTRTVSVSGVIAPFSTTYTSSAVANSMKFGAAPLLFEQSIAQRVIEAKKTGTDVQITDIEQEARGRTEKLMSELTDLMTALAANIQGGVLAGDPPQFFGLVDQWGNWKRLGKAEAFGLANDVLMSAGLTYMWCKKAGIENPDIISRLREHTTEVTKQAAEGVKASVSKKDQTAESTAAAIDLVTLDFDSPGPDKKNQLKAVIQYTMKVDVGRFGRKKLEAMRGLTPDILNRLFGSQKNGEALTTEQQATLLRDMLFAKGAEHAEDIKGLQSQLGDPFSPVELSKMLGGVLKDVDEAAAIDVNEGKEVTGVDTELQNTVVRKIEKEQKDAVNATLVVEAILKEEGWGTADLSYMNEVEKRAEVLRVIQEKMKDDPQGVKKLQERMAHVQDAHGHLLNHAGKEVLYALLTQLPAVGPASVLAEQAISGAFDLKGGENRSSVNEMVVAIGAALTSEAFLSSIADNVAAYKYAYKLLCKMVERVYGETVQKQFGKKVLEQFPSLHDAIFAISLKVAEQAGAMTKLGNGPNFSQYEVVLMSPDEYKIYIDGITDADEKGKILKMSKKSGSYVATGRPLPLKPWTNTYANVANAALIGVSTAWLYGELSSLDSAITEQVAV